MAKKATVVRVVLDGGRVVEIKRTESHATIILKKGTSFVSKSFSAKCQTTVEISENQGNVSVTLRPPKGGVKMEMMNFK